MARYTNFRGLSTALRQRAGQWNWAADEISIVDARISKKIATELQNEIIDNYNNFINTKADKRQFRENTVVYIERNNKNSYSVNVEGYHVIYDEFGTGTMGERNPHPKKSNYALNPYNSGRTIRENKNGVKYWTYHGNVTYGQPAGMFVYNSLMNVADRQRELAREEIEKILTKKGK